MESATKPNDLAKVAISNNIGQLQKSAQVNPYSGNVNSIYNSAKAQPDLASNNEPSKLLNYQPSSYLNYNYPRSPNDKMLDDNLYANRGSQLGADYSSGNNNGYGLPAWNQYALPSDVYKTDKLASGYANEPDQYGAPIKESLYWPSFNYQQTNSELQGLQPHSSHQQQQDIPYNSLPLSITETQNRLTEFQAQNRQQPQGLPQSPIYNRYFGNSVPLASKSEPVPTSLNATVARNIGDTKPANSGSSVTDNKPSGPKIDYAHISSSQKQIPVAAPNIVAISHLRDTSPQSGRETNSAVIALTLGLFVTTILIVIVGCRMKSFKQRLARRGRSLAHDADYLVNGMYLWNTVHTIDKCNTF